MECCEPGIIQEYELLAYLGGEQVRPIVIEHIARCPHCTARLKTFRRLDKALSLKLNHYDCPDTLKLGEYQLGMLDSREAEKVRQHLAICTRCAVEDGQLETFMAPGVTPVRIAPLKRPSLNNHHSARESLRALEQLGRQAREGVRRVIATLQPPQPRLSYLRDVASPTATWPRRYQAEDVQISIQLEPDGKNKLQLVGFVERKDHGLEALQGISVLLYGPAGATSTQAIDELGNFVFAALVPATYTLELNFPEATFAIEQLTIQA